MTQGNFGSIKRHYIICTKDNAIPLAAQNHMIKIVDEAMGNATVTHTMETSHSPFFSQTNAFVDILVSIAS